jgi:hypothetical protein
MSSTFEVLMATERVMHDTVSAIVRAASLRPGKFELTASEQYLVNCANDEVRKADAAHREHTSRMCAQDWLD